MPEPGPGALIGAIDERASEERARLVAEAEARAEEIGAAAEAECERIRADGLARLESELAAEQQRLIGDERMKARAESLAMRRALLAEAFQRAAGEIQRMKAGAAGPAARDALAAEARAAVGEPCTLEVSDDGGRVIATSADGKRAVENSLDGRLRRAQAAAEPDVARRLFSAPGSTGAGPGSGSPSSSGP